MGVTLESPTYPSLHADSTAFFVDGGRVFLIADGTLRLTEVFFFSWPRGPVTAM